MKKLSKQGNQTNQNIRYFDHTSKMIVELGNKKRVKHDDSYLKMTDIKNSSEMSIIETSKNNVSHSEENIITGN